MLIGSKKQRNHVTKEDVSFPKLLEEAVMPMCAQEERDVAVASIPNACTQTVTSDHFKDYLSSGNEGCNRNA